MNRMGKLALVGSVLALGALGAWGCEERSPSGLAGASGPGAEATGVLSGWVELRAPDGTTRRDIISARPFRVSLRRGVTHEPGTGAPIALRGALAAGGNQSQFVDSAGHQHELRLLGSSGGPPDRAEHFVDGVLFASADFTWATTSAGYLLESQTSTMYQGGEPFYQDSLGVSQPQLALGRGGRIRAAALALCGAALPAPLLAATPQFWVCWDQWFDYAIASFAMVVAAQRVYASFWMPSSWGVFLTTAQVWRVTLDRLIDCMVINDE
jgi:hypothetical protein